jgi:hypothetical protein
VREAIVGINLKSLAATIDRLVVLARQVKNPGGMVLKSVSRLQSDLSGSKRSLLGFRALTPGKRNRRSFI